MSSILGLVEALQKAANQQDGETRKLGEAALKQWSAERGFLSGLLEIYRQENYGLDVRWLAIIYFKNSIDNDWRKSAAVNATPEEKGYIRSSVLDLVELPVPAQLQRQLAVVVGKIAKHDFPRAWPNLFDELKTRILALMQNEALGALANVLSTTNQIVKAVATSRIGPARGHLNELSPEFLRLTGSVYLHLMGTASSDVFPVAYQALKITCTLMYDGDDRMSRHPDACSFFSSSLEVLEKLTGDWLAAPSDELRKHITRLGKMYLRFVEKHPVSFCLMPRALDVVEFYRQVIVSKGPQLSSAGVDANDQSEFIKFFDRVVIQGSIIIKGLLKLAQKDPCQTSLAVIPLNMRPRNDQDKAELFAAYDMVTTGYFKKDGILSQLVTAILESMLIQRHSDLELWGDDPEEFIVEDVLATYEYRVATCFQALYVQLLKSFPMVKPQVLAHVERIIQNEQTDLNQVLALDGALQALQYGAQAFSSDWEIEPVLRNILLPRLQGTSTATYKIIRRRICLLISEWLPIQGNDELRILVYQMVIELLFVSDPLNDLPVELAALDALKVAVDDLDFSVEGFLPFAEQTFTKIYDLLNNKVESVEIRRHILEVMNTLVEQLGRSLSVRHIETILKILPPLWDEQTEDQLTKTVILQTLMHLVDAAREKSPVCYPMALKALDASISPNSPLMSYLIDDALGLWKSLIVNAAAPNETLLGLVPYLMDLLKGQTENLGEELSLLESYIKLEPHLVNNSQTTVEIFSLANVYMPDASVEIVMSMVEVVQLMVATNASTVLPSLAQSGLINLLMRYASTSEGDKGDIALRISANKVFVVFSWLSFNDPEGFVSLINTVLEQQGCKENLAGLVKLWISSVHSLSSPAERKLLCLGVSSCLLARPELIVLYLRDYVDLWSTILDEITETNGDADIYHTGELYAGETEEDLSPEQIRYRAHKKMDPVHVVDLRLWINNLTKDLANTDPRCAEALNSWGVPPAATSS